jgi:hypothetical protein
MKKNVNGWMLDIQVRDGKILIDWKNYLHIIKELKKQITQGTNKKKSKK